MARLAWPTRRLLWMAMGVIFLIAIFTYAYAVNLPFRIDDFVHFRWLYTRSLADVWSNAAGLAYYRPLPFTIWKLIYWIAGDYPAPVMHAINVVLHAANSSMVMLLIWLHGKQNPVGVGVATLAALLFLLFPFSYQAVPWAGALSHPLVTLLMLGSLLMAVRADQRNLTRYKVVALSLAVIAPFAHETGVLIAPLLSLYLYTAESSKSFKGVVRATAIYWVTAIVAGLLLIVLRMNAGLVTAMPQWESRLQNGIYFLQGLLYPIAPIATLIHALIPQINDLGAVVAVCIPALCALVYVCVKLGQAKRLWFALGWYAITILPAWLLLPFAYVVDGPRLMYVSSIGAALLWTIPFAALVERFIAEQLDKIGKTKLLLSALVVAGVIIGSASFLRERADMYEQTRRAASGFMDSIAAADGKGHFISVNFPGFLAPKSPTYVLGHEGVSFIPDYSSVIDLVWTMTGQERSISNFVVEELQSQWRYNFRNYGNKKKLIDLQPSIRTASRVFFTNYRRDNLETFDVGSLLATKKPPPTEYVSSYADQLLLLSGEWRLQDDKILVTLHWQCLTKLQQEVRTYVHLQTESGELVAQEDGLPLMGLANPVWWQSGDEWRDLRVVVLSHALKPGRYFLRVGVYPVDGSARLVATDPTNHRIENDSATFAEFTVP